jgi:hypothetical protein
VGALLFKTDCCDAWQWLGWQGSTAVQIPTARHMCRQATIERPLHRRFTSIVHLGCMLFAVHVVGRGSGRARCHVGLFLRQCPRRLWSVLVVKFAQETYSIHVYILGHTAGIIFTRQQPPVQHTALGFGTEGARQDMSSFLTEAQRAALDAALAERLAAGGGASRSTLP